MSCGTAKGAIFDAASGGFLLSPLGLVDLVFFLGGLDGDSSSDETFGEILLGLSIRLERTLGADFGLDAGFLDLLPFSAALAGDPVLEVWPRLVAMLEVGVWGRCPWTKQGSCSTS